ncbi:universal stress protein [Yinghuangia seranimata]|uniref:universal stress protein n=1 Tax=Yinghuangia seranimata TaxID=408067 RepID=UPI00248B9B2C|nr:universal stress protein [Yinghuangia seranimata]MDI2131004.1 universal stress protein [Yinghuangia seranimata]
MYARILVAVDTTPETTDVLARTAALANAFDATVRVLHVQTLDVVAGAAGGGAVVEESAEEATKAVTGAVDTLRAAGVESVEGWTDETLRADVPNAVLDQAKDFGADLLVLGARRDTGLARLFLGSVSDAVVHRAPCPVLLVP